MRYAMIIDLDACIGCRACEVACKVENLTPKSVSRCHVLKIEQERTPYATWLRLSCCHCAEPSCLASCPAGAITQKDNGLVVMDKEVCVGCGECLDSCPYHIVTRSTGQGYFDAPAPYETLADPHQRHPQGRADKCTFCEHLLARGEQPRCVSACVTGALFFGDADDSGSEFGKLWKKAVPLPYATGGGPAIALLQADDRHANMREVGRAVAYDCLHSLL